MTSSARKSARRTASSRSLGVAPISSAPRSGQRAALGAILADHNTQLDSRIDAAASVRPNALCLHLDGYGTRSSSLIFMRRDADEIAHYFAPGPPCRTAYDRAMVPRRLGKDKSLN